MGTVLYYVAGVLAALSLVFLVVAIRAVRSRRWLGSTGSGLTGTLFLSLAALAATLGVFTQGYRALTLEEVAATWTGCPDATWTSATSGHALARSTPSRPTSRGISFCWPSATPFSPSSWTPSTAPPPTRR